MALLVRSRASLGLGRLDLVEVGPLLRSSACTKRPAGVTLNGIDDLCPGDLSFLVGVNGDVDTERIDL